MDNNILQALAAKNANRKQIVTGLLNLNDDTTDDSKFRKQCAVTMQTILEQSLNPQLAQETNNNSNLVKQDGWKATE